MNKASANMGVVILILGLVLTPVCVGIPIVIYAATQIGQDVVRRCSRCGMVHPLR